MTHTYTNMLTHTHSCPSSHPHEQVTVSGVCWWSHLALNLGLAATPAALSLPLTVTQYHTCATQTMSAESQSRMINWYMWLVFIFRNELLFHAVIKSKWIFSCLLAVLFSFESSCFLRRIMFICIYLYIFIYYMCTVVFLIAAARQVFFQGTRK